MKSRADDNKNIEIHEKKGTEGLNILKMGFWTKHLSKLQAGFHLQLSINISLTE
jgi:hypothetical protein